MEELDGWDKEKIQKLATEIAIRGLRGIKPSDESGYSVPTFPGRDFGGYAFLAYYYVSWKLYRPEMIKQMGLNVYDLAYAAAKRRFDIKKKSGNTD